MSSTLRLDLHVHSRRSPDSSLTLEEAVARLGVVGLHGLALTDHNTIEGHAELRELARKYPTYQFVPGVEVSTREGHLLVYGIDELPPLRRPLLETLDWVRARGARAVLAHPMRWLHGVGGRVASKAPVPALETMNGHNAEITNARAALLAARRGLGETGGSDAHSMAGVGRAFTEFTSDASTLEALLGELTKARTRAVGRSLGPFELVRLGVRSGILRAVRGFGPI